MSPLASRKKWRKMLVFLLMGKLFFVHATESALFNSPADVGPGRHQIESVFLLIKQIQWVEADFQELKIFSGGGKLQSQGHFIFSRENGIYRKMDSPIKMETLLTRWELIEKNDRGEVSSFKLKTVPQAKAQAEIFFSLFLGQSALFEKQFNLFFTGDIARWELGLQPKPESLSSQRIRDIVLNGIGGQINRIVVSLEDGGQVVTDYTSQSIVTDNNGTPSSLPPFPILSDTP